MSITGEELYFLTSLVVSGPTHTNLKYSPSLFDRHPTLERWVKLKTESDGWFLAYPNKKAYKIVREAKTATVSSLPLFPSAETIIEVGSWLLNRPYDLPHNSGQSPPDPNPFHVFKAWRYLGFIIPRFISYRLTFKGRSYLQHHLLDWVGAARPNDMAFITIFGSKIPKQDRAIVLSLVKPEMTEKLIELWV